MSKIDELLKVLDMAEGDQLIWCAKNAGFNLLDATLADLAFRLRDEAIAKDDKSEIDCWWCEASYQVYLYVIGEENEQDEAGLDTWFSMRAQPIHWIISSLIAKELSNENKS